MWRRGGRAGWTSSLAPVDAEPPFNDHDADLILRSSDLVDFHVYRIILSLASPVFKTMIAALVTTSSPPTMDMPEDAHTIDYILRCCYPIPTPRLSLLSNIRCILPAAVKYSIGEVRAIASAALTKHCSHDSLSVFAIASRCEMYDVCTSAALNFGSRQLLQDSIELDCISARLYHKFLQFSHRRPILSDWNDKQWASDDITSADLGGEALQIEPGTARAPFDNVAADVILRSSDNVQFYVFRSILSLASPFFSDMFSLPQALEPPAQQQVVEMTEDARTINFLLRLCHPVPRPSLVEFKDIRLVLEASHKYDVAMAMSAAKTALEQCIDRDVLGTFVVAVRCEFRDISIAAAKRFTHHSLLSLDSPELDNVFARPYHSLLNYHHRCCEAACAVVSGRTWLRAETCRIGGEQLTTICQSCQEHKYPGLVLAPREAWTYLSRAKQALRLCPHQSAVVAEDVLASWTPAGIFCADCGSIYSRDRLSQALADQVERAVAEVEIPDFF